MRAYKRMSIFIPKEIISNENRVAAIPATVKSYVKKEITVYVESGAGAGAFISDEEYKNSGAIIVDDPERIYSQADIILKVNPPSMHEVVMMKEHAIVISLIQTTKALDVVQKYLDKKITGFSMHLIPRTTLAQKMDALSSQASIAGYKAVLVGACQIGKYMPLLMTAAGTILPSKVLILGAGVAGLQAIATAKRLGALVEAFDVRSVVKEQVESLGAKFIEVLADEEEGVGGGGYAKETSEAYKERQIALIKEHVAKADLVISTALIPGRPAPILITHEMVDGMSAGSVIIDLAAENGGNCELTKPGEVSHINGVTIDGRLNWPSTIPIHASQLYAKNILALVDHLYPKGELNLNIEDEIIASAMFTHDGEVKDKSTVEAMRFK